MLTCTPQSIFSWNFEAARDGIRIAQITFNFWTEQGTIVWNGVPYVIDKQGPMSGRWTLEKHGEVFAEAQKTPMVRSFDLNVGDDHLTLKAKSVFRRSFTIDSGSVSIGTIRPMNIITRCSIIECTGKMSELHQLFAFWLVALTWRRAARRNN